jgi:hypothetical protein
MGVYMEIVTLLQLTELQQQSRDFQSQATNLVIMSEKLASGWIMLILQHQGHKFA